MSGGESVRERSLTRGRRGMTVAGLVLEDHRPDVNPLGTPKDFLYPDRCAAHHGLRVPPRCDDCIHVAGKFQTSGPAVGDHHHPEDFKRRVMNRVHAWHTFTAGHSITADAVAFAMGEGVEKKGEGKGETEEEEEEEETNPSTVCRGGHKFYRDDRAQAAGEVDPLVAMGVGLLEKGFAPA